MHLLRQTLSYLPAQILGPLCQFAAAIGWTHYLAPADYGVVAYVIAAQEVTMIVSTQWWSLFGARFFRRFVRDGSLDDFRDTDVAVLSAGAVIQAVLAAAVVATIDMLTPSLVIGTTIFFITRVGLYHYSEVSRAAERSGVYSIAQMSSAVVGSLMTFPVLLYVSQSYEALIWTFVVPQTIALVIVLRMLGVRRGGRGVNRAMILAGLRYGVPAIVGAVALWFGNNSIRYVVEWQWGLAAVGLVSVGWGLGLRLASVLSMLSASAAFPRAVTLFEAGDAEDALRQVSLGGAMLLALLAPTAAGLILVAPDLTQLVVAETFRQVTEQVLPIAFLAGMMRALRSHFLDQPALLRERVTVLPVINALDAVLSTAGCVLGGLHGGIVGAAIGGFLGSIPSLFVSAAFAVRCGLRLPWSLFARVLAGVAVMVVALRLLPQIHGIAGLALTVGTGALVYAATLAILFRTEIRSLRPMAA